jgi:hypothetical protein
MSLEEQLARLDEKLDGMRDTFAATTDRIVEAVEHVKDSAPNVDFAPLVSEIHAARQEICEKLDAFEDDEPDPEPPPEPPPLPEPEPEPPPLPEPEPEPEPPKPMERAKKGLFDSLFGLSSWE